MSCRDKNKKNKKKMDISGRAFQAQGSGRSGSDGGSEKSSDSKCTLRVTPAGCPDDGLDVGYEENKSQR